MPLRRYLMLFAKHFIFILLFLFLAALWVACEILVPQPGIEPVPPAVEAWILNHWTARAVLSTSFWQPELSVTCSATSTLEQDFSTSALLIFGTRQFFAVGGCPVDCRMFSRAPGPYQLDASSSLPTPTLLWQPKMSPDIAKCLLGGNLATVANLYPKTVIILEGKHSRIYVSSLGSQLYLSLLPACLQEPSSSLLNP